MSGVGPSPQFPIMPSCAFSSAWLVLMSTRSGAGSPKGGVAMEHGASKVIADGLEIRMGDDRLCVATVIKIKQSSGK